MGKTDRRRRQHLQQSMVLVPMETPGVTDRARHATCSVDDAPSRSPRDRLRQRARACRQHAARRRPRLRDRAGPPGSRPHPSLQRLIGCAQRALELMCRPIARRALRSASRSANRARCGRISPIPGARSNRPPADAAGRGKDGPRGQQGRARPDRRGENRGTGDGRPRDRPRDPDPWRRRRLAGHVSGGGYTYARFMRIGDGPDQVHLSQLGRGLLSARHPGLTASGGAFQLLCLRSSRRAIWLRCTSSGPSARRSRRARGIGRSQAEIVAGAAAADAPGSPSR